MHMAVMATFCISRIQIDEMIASTMRVEAKKERGLGEANTSSSPAFDAAWYLFD